MNRRGLLSLMTRTLRVDSRAVWTYLLRFGLIAFVFVALISAQQTSLWFGAPGLRLFQTLVFINFAFISLAGLSIFATSITEEKEEMTLGLLRMTSLSPVAILLGKSSSRLVEGMLLLLAQFPFTLLAIALGGVSMAQIVATYCSLGAYMLLLCNLALFCSVCSRRSVTSAGLTLLMLLVFLVGPWAGKGVMAWLFYKGAVAQYGRTAVVVESVLGRVVDASPITRLQAIVTTGFDDSSVVGYQVTTNLIGAAVFFLLAWLTFDLFNRNETAASPARPASLFAVLKKRRSRRAWGRALVWKDFNFIAGGMMHQVVKLILYGVVTCLLVYMASEGRRISSVRADEVGGPMMWGFLMVGILELAIIAGRIFREEVKWRTLSGLMTLPIPMAKVAYLKIAGCLLTLIPAVLFFLIGACLAWDDFVDVIGEMVYEPGTYLVVALVVFFIHLVAYLSLWLKWGALAAAIGILVLGYMFCGTFVGLIVMAFFSANMGNGMYWNTLAVLGTILLLALSAGMHIHSGHRLVRLAAV